MSAQKKSQDERMKVSEGMIEEKDAKLTKLELQIVKLEQALNE